MAANSQRNQGLMLMGLGVLVFLGTNAQLLPAVTFFPAAGACAIGVVLFMKGNRAAGQQEAERVRRALDPGIRNESLERYAAGQAQADGRVLENLSVLEGGRVPAERAEPAELATDELVLYEVDQPGTEGVAADAPDDPDEDASFVVSTDVSFPVELQEQRSLAEQLQKLNGLREDGIINDEEFAIAKAKLLG